MHCAASLVTRISSVSLLFVVFFCFCVSLWFLDTFVLFVLYSQSHSILFISSSDPFLLPTRWPPQIDRQSSIGRVRFIALSVYSKRVEVLWSLKRGRVTQSSLRRAPNRTSRLYAFPFERNPPGGSSASVLTRYWRFMRARIVRGMSTARSHNQRDFYWALRHQSSKTISIAVSHYRAIEPRIQPIEAMKNYVRFRFWYTAYLVFSLVWLFVWYRDDAMMHLMLYCVYF